jgi:hypothetical protein
MGNSLGAATAAPAGGILTSHTGNSLGAAAAAAATRRERRLGHRKDTGDSLFEIARRSRSWETSLQLKRVCHNRGVGDKTEDYRHLIQQYNPTIRISAIHSQSLLADKLTLTDDRMLRLRVKTNRECSSQASPSPKRPRAMDLAKGSIKH